MRDRFKFCDAMVTRVACFDAAHRTVYKQHLSKMDIVFAFHCWIGRWCGMKPLLIGTKEWDCFETFHTSNIVCRALGTILGIGELCVRVWLGHGIGSRKHSTSSPICLHLGIDDSTVLQAQPHGKCATTCAAHSYWMNQLDENISFTELMNVKFCSFHTGTCPKEAAMRICQFVVSACTLKRLLVLAVCSGHEVCLFRMKAAHAKSYVSSMSTHDRTYVFAQCVARCATIFSRKNSFFFTYELVHMSPHICTLYDMCVHKILHANACGGARPGM